jgi:hypothetical protein
MPNTPILGIPQVSPTQAQKEVTINDAIVALEAATNGNLTVTYGTEVTKTLSEAQFTRNFLFTADITTADAILQVPATIAGDPAKRLFAVRNKTTFGLTVRSASGTGDSITIPNGEARLLAMVDDDVIVAAQPSTPVGFLALAETPDSYAGKAGQFLKVASSEDGLVFVAVLDTIDNFADVDLSGQVDGQALIRVGGVWKPGNIPSSVHTFLALDDVPDTYGAAGTFVRVNGDGNGVEFIAINQVPAGTGTEGQILTKGTGTDYAWGDAPVALPNGGTTGQVLTKASDTDGDAEWAEPSGGGGGGALPAGGTPGQFLAKASITDGDADWVDAPTGSVPSGGTTGQVLTKLSDTDGDVDWADVTGIADGTHFTSLYSWNQAVDGNLAGGTTIVVDVSDYDEILLLYDRVTKTTASSETVRFSTDGGVTFDSGNNYLVDLTASGGVGFSDNALYSSGSGSGSRVFMWRASNLRSAISPKPVFGNRQGLYVGYAAVTHVQFTIATTYNGGRINVLGLTANGGGGSGSGLPAGGTTGQFLAKASGTDGDADWVDAPTGSVPSGGTTGQVLTKVSNADGDVDWADAGSSGTQRVLASARIDCTAPTAPVVSHGSNVASVTRTGTGRYTVTFNTALADLTKVGFNSGGQWALSGSSHNGMDVTIDMAAGKGLTTTEINLVAHAVSDVDSANGEIFDADGWFSFELYDVTATGGGSGGGGGPVTESIIIPVGDESAAVVAGPTQVKFRMPYAFTVTKVKASLNGASSSGNPTVDINEAGVSILSTKLSIDSGETTSTTATTAAVISDPSLADDAEITIDVDIAGTGATGLKVYVIGHQ